MFIILFLFVKAGIASNVVSIQQWVIKHLTQYIQIFAGATLGFLIFGDIPTLNNYLGNVLIIGAGIYIIIREVTLSKKIVSVAARPATIPTEAKE